MIAIDIGCGANKKAGSIGVDCATLTGVDVVATVERLPFRESSVDTIYAKHVLEHVEPLVPVIEEMWRVSKPGARIHVWAPHCTCGLYVWGDPTHRRAFTSLTFDYFVPGASFGYYSRARFSVIRRELHFGGRRWDGTMPGLSPATTALKRIAGRLLEPLANFSRLAQLLCERTWGMWVGFEEIYFQLVAVKATSSSDVDERGRGRIGDSFRPPV